MRWPPVVVIGYLLLGLELGLRDGLTLGASGGAAPSFVLPFVVFVALHAPHSPALWTALLMGLSVDLTTVRGTNSLVIVGPNALGYLLAAYFVLTIRGIMIRRNPWVLVLLSVLSSLLAGVVVVAIFTFRRIYHEGMDFGSSEQLVQRFFASLLTAGTALVVAALLFPVAGVFGFADPHLRRSIGRTR
jgi:rod shape-determining protein MreD